jgi:hypothetical protein
LNFPFDRNPSAFEDTNILISTRDIDLISFRGKKIRFRSEERKKLTYKLDKLLLDTREKNTVERTVVAVDGKPVVEAFDEFQLPKFLAYQHLYWFTLVDTHTVAFEGKAGKVPKWSQVKCTEGTGRKPWAGTSPYRA